MEKRVNSSQEKCHVEVRDPVLGHRDFVVTTLDGTIEFSAWGAREPRLKDGSHEASLAQSIRSHVTGGAAQRGLTTGYLEDGRQVSSVRLDGPSGPRYLVVLYDITQCRNEAEGLTPRQLEIAEYAAVGATSKEIAKSLKISPLTVKTHLRTIYERLEVGNRIELADALKPRR